MIILLSVLFCLVLNLVPEAPRLLAEIEADAAVLSAAIFTVIIFRIWLTTQDASKSASTQPQS